MLARFEPALKDFGPSMYPRLFWETGLIGQVLYLEAHAFGVSATGIGCFFDDPGKLHSLSHAYLNLALVKKSSSLWLGSNITGR